MTRCRTQQQRKGEVFGGQALQPFQADPIRPMLKRTGSSSQIRHHHQSFRLLSRPLRPHHSKANKNEESDILGISLFFFLFDKINESLDSLILFIQFQFLKTRQILHFSLNQRFRTKCIWRLGHPRPEGFVAIQTSRNGGDRSQSAIRITTVIAGKRRCDRPGETQGIDINDIIIIMQSLKQAGQDWGISCFQLDRDRGFAAIGLAWLDS